jgi:hypothetical protein
MHNLYGEKAAPLDAGQPMPAPAPGRRAFSLATSFGVASPRVYSVFLIMGSGAVLLGAVALAVWLVR